MRPFRVAVIGAGVAGLSCARMLHDHACSVVVFERGRGAGGRLATRRFTAAGEETCFDHGAPFFTVTDARFDRFVLAWIADGVCARWSVPLATWRDGQMDVHVPERPFIVGIPGMNAVTRHLATGLDVRAGTGVTALLRGDGCWKISTDAETPAPDEFDALILAMPAPQAQRLMPAGFPRLDHALASIEMRPTWITMMHLDTQVDDLPPLVEFADDAVLEKIVRDDAKPGRARSAGRSSWVVHARSAWSRERYDAPREEIAAALTAAAAEALGNTGGKPIRDRTSFSAAHRWGFARAETTSTETCVFDPAARLGVCGEGFGGAGVQAAFLSGRAAAASVLATRVSSITSD